MESGYGIIVDARSSTDPARHHAFAAIMTRGEVPLPGRHGRPVRPRKGFVTLVLAGDLLQGPFSSLKQIIGALRGDDYDRIRIFRHRCREVEELFALPRRAAEA